VSPKQTLPGQHVILEKAWPGDCCLCTHEATIADLRAENARLQEQMKEADEVVVLAVAALHERVQEVDLLKRERDDYKALAELRGEALDAWVRYSLSSKPSKELLVEALRLTDAAEEPR